MNKLCDGADWFRPEIDRIIREEFEDVPRFHRKQWEFAVIFWELERRGLLNGQTEGISFGSATEHMLYAVARRVKHIWATDLYGTAAAWDIARTDSPIDLIKRRAPFPYPEERLSAKNMDMRTIEFADESFDFAYSSCAIEHIGHRKDFVRHLREVQRILRPGGVYVFTTELTYTDRTVEMEGNYYFSRALLEEIIRESGLDTDPEFDASLTAHRINTPLPVELSCGFNDGEGGFNAQLFGLIVHLQLASANSAFTSCVVVLHKNGQTFKGWRYKGWDEAQRFIARGIDRLRAVVEASDLILHPFAWMPNRKSLRYVGHAEYFRQTPDAKPDPGIANTLFHTAYVWLGRKPRTVRVSLGLQTAGEYAINLKIYRVGAARPWAVEAETVIDIRGSEARVLREVPVQPLDDCSYAVLAELTGGELSLTEAYVTCVAATDAAAEAAGEHAFYPRPYPRLPAGGALSRSALGRLWRRLLP